MKWPNHYFQCDQRKPGCLKCEKKDEPCPGYRNLADVMFRNESERTIRKVRAFQNPVDIEQLRRSSTQRRLSNLSQIPQSGSPSSLSPMHISSALSQPINELGANFFFTNYALDESPYSPSYQTWLIQTYHEEHPGHFLRTAIEAVGMAGISNVFHAPGIAFRSKEQYSKVLAATKKALSDPVEAISDTTFMSVILLGMFEVYQSS